MLSWFEADPALLNEELEALNRTGYQYKIDEAARADARLVIMVTYLIDDTEHILKCEYPSSYPYFAVKVYAPTFPPGRHLDPYHYVLCLFEEEQSAWDPENDNLATTLDIQIPYILSAHTTPNIPNENEGKVGYQVTGQIPYENRSVIFVDDWLIPNSSTFGEMTIKLHLHCKINTPIIGFIETLNCQGKIIVENDFPFKENYTKRLPARWVKLDRPPKSIDGENVLTEAINICSKIKTPNFKHKDIDIVGIVFEEESEYFEPVLNWIFVIRRRTKKNKKITVPMLSIIRSDRLTQDSVQIRVPKLRPLKNKSIIIFGVGALGSHIIWQLARAGVTSITLIDGDIVQAGNIPRWLLGFSAIGHSKVHIISQFLLQNYPNIKFQPIPLRIGVYQKINVDDNLVNEHEYLCGLIQQSDIVIDAAAETNISLYLSSICSDLKKSYIWATGTQGAWGGIVGRIIPDITEGTWMCFSHQYSNGDIIAPPAEEGSDIQPVGCFHKTFTGTGFDMDHISLMATRLTISTLLREEQGGYPDFDWDIGVLHLWDETTGFPVAPKWHTERLKKYTPQKIGV